MKTRKHHRNSFNIRLAISCKHWGFRLFYIVLLIGVFSCKKTVNNPELELITVGEFVTETEFWSLQAINCCTWMVGRDTFCNLYFQEVATREIICMKLYRDSLVRDESMNFVQPAFYFGMYFISPDSVLVYDNEIENKLRVVRGNGELIRAYQIEETCTPVVTPNNRLVGSHGLILIGNSSKTIDAVEKKERFEYYTSIKPVMRISMNDTGIRTDEFGRFPDKYLETGANYYDHFPAACFGPDGEICFSFAADDYVYLYRDTVLIAEKIMKSNYIDEFSSIPDDKRFDILYLKNFMIEEPKYINIIWDPWEKVYLRVAKHRWEFDITGKRTGANEWSVIAADRELNVIGEKKFNYSGQPQIVIPTPLGIVMARTREDGETTISIVKIKRHD